MSAPVILGALEPPRRAAGKHEPLVAPSPFKSRGGLGRLVAATRYSIDGLRAAWRDEAAFRQELVACAVLVPIALGLPVSPLERLALLAVLALLLIVELLNSALEAAVDRVGIERNTLSKKAKDLGSAAVMVTIVLALATWAVVLWPVLKRVLG